jgi:putative DNA primase/helicase
VSGAKSGVGARADASGNAANNGPQPTAKKESRAQRVIRELTQVVTFWHNPDGDSYATVMTPELDHVERYRVSSKAFRNFVRGFYGKALTRRDMEEVVAEIDARAIQGVCQQPRVRVAELNGAVVIDFGTADWSAVVVTPNGWRIERFTTAPLIRPPGFGAMVTPVHGNSAEDIQRLYKLVNIHTLDQLMLSTAWSVAALFPHGPYPILAVDGAAECAKTTYCELMKKLVDPNTSGKLAAPPKHESDIMINARNARVLTYDNLSSMSAELADTLCRVATGAEQRTRQLYTDADESSAEACNPVMLNGINEMLQRADFGSRSIKMSLETIPAAKRRTMRTIEAAFAEHAPFVLGALLDGLATALRNRPTIQLPELSRLADFTELVCAAAPAFGWTAGEMLAALQRNQGDAAEIVIENDAVATAVQSFMVGKLQWSGAPTELLGQLLLHSSTSDQRDRYWPSNANHLSRRLRRVLPALRGVGLAVVLPVAGGRSGRVVTIRRVLRAGQSVAAEVIHIRD